MHTTHVPNGSQGYVKPREGDGGARLEKEMDTLEAVHRALATNLPMPRVLTGDFNEPRAELPNGGFTYWIDYQKTPRQYRDRWRAAAAGVFERLPQLGVRDVFRELHGMEGTSSSWTARNGAARCYDHIFASRHLHAVSCEYDAAFRVGKTGHTAIVARLRLA